MRLCAATDTEATKRELALLVLRTHGHCRLQVAGSSMLPNLWPGDTVLIETRKFSDLQVGDAVLFERLGGMFLHRIVRRSFGAVGAALVTRGDSMQQEDEPIEAASSLGVLAAVQRGGDWIAVDGPPSRASRAFGLLLSRSSFLARLALLLRYRLFQFRLPLVSAPPMPETPAS